MLLRENQRLNRWYPKKAQTPTNTKNSRIFNRVTQMLTLLSAIDEITVSTMMPKISSITAAPKMVLATLVFNLPNSFRVSTVMLTLVAVRITPMNTC